MADPLTSGYKIVRLTKVLLKGLAELYRITYHIKTDVSHLHKKYDTAFTGKKYVGYIACSEEGDPAAYYGVFPCFIQYQDKKILAAQSGDTMTGPAHQGKGLFTLLAKKTYELAEQEGIKLVFGFPNKNSYPGFVKKLKWIHKGNMRTYSFKVKALPILKAAKKSGMTGLYQGYAMCILKNYISKKNSFVNSCLDSKHGGILRDEAFLSYKTYSSNFVLEIEGALIWLKLDGKLWIGDIQRTGIETFRKVLEKMKKLCIALGCTEIAFNLSPGSYWDQILAKEYKATEGLPIGYLDINSGLNLDTIHFTGGDFDTF